MQSTGSPTSTEVTATSKIAPTTTEELLQVDAALQQLKNRNALVLRIYQMMHPELQAASGSQLKYTPKLTPADKLQLHQVRLLSYLGEPTEELKAYVQLAVIRDPISGKLSTVDSFTV